MIGSRIRRATLIAASFAGIAGMLAGCDTAQAIRGAGTMRVDVEVYKGPLSKDPWTQFGELLGIMNDAARAIDRMLDFMEVSSIQRVISSVEGSKSDPNRLRVLQQDMQQRATGKNTDVDKIVAISKNIAAEPCDPSTPLTPTEAQRIDMIWARVSGILAANMPKQSPEEVIIQIYIRDLKLIREYFICKNIDLSNIQSILSASANDSEALAQKIRANLAQMVEMSTKMKAFALYVQGVHVAAPMWRRVNRATATGWAVTLAEYSNQIASRADALLQQMNKIDRRELPLSVQLRDTAPTDFFNLFIWNRAAFPEPYRLFSFDETVRDRVRGMERLYADHNWSRINTVYASGQGDVSMAFIKDDIGNWNLKSFDNDPTELLQGYFGIAKAALATATSIAQGAATGGGTAAVGQLVDLSNRIAFGQSSSTSGPLAGNLNAEALHQRAVKRLGDLQKDMETKSGDLQKKIDEKTAEIKAISDSDADKPRKDEAKKELEKLKADHTKLPTIALESTHAILREHGAIIDILQESVVSPNAPINTAAPGPIPSSPPRSLPNPLGQP